MNQSSLTEKVLCIENEYKSLLQQPVPQDANKISSLREEYRKSIEKMSCPDQAAYFFGNQIDHLRPKRDVLACILVIKDEPHINILIEKLKSCGFEQIILIDDHSTQVCLAQQDQSVEVKVLQVKAGTFGLSKTLWIESICNLLFDESWVATIDADEFIDIDSYYQATLTIKGLANARNDLKGFLQNYDHPVIPFCLLDVFPSDLSQPAEILFNSNFYYFFCPDKSLLQDYGSMPAVKWSFGKKYYAQYFTDLRYHLYHIAESRSKISMVRWCKRKKLMLHQGFHNITDRSTGTVYDITWARNCRVPCKTIIHQKVLFTSLNPPSSGKLSQYFPRTAQNISLLTRELGDETSSGSRAADIKSLVSFRGTIFMPSWTLNGKLLYVDEATLDCDAWALRDNYEFVWISELTFRSIMVNINYFVALRVVKINRCSRYIQLRNISV